MKTGRPEHGSACMVDCGYKNYALAENNMYSADVDLISSTHLALLNRSIR